MRGVANIIIKFGGSRTAAWVIEVGVENGGAATKLPQAQDYAKALNAKDFFCCAIVTSPAVLRTPPNQRRLPRGVLPSRSHGLSVEAMVLGLLCKFQHVLCV